MNMDNIYLALQLMIVGMATVFLILYIIIGLGKLLVKITNANATEEPVVPKPQATATTALDPVTQSVIQMAVSEITGGKGHATNIKKLS